MYVYYACYAVCECRLVAYMSQRCVDLVVTVENLTPTQVLVLYRLADRANAEGYAWPGIPLLIKETRMSRRTLYYALRQLEARQIIVKRKGTYTTHFHNAYFMMYAKSKPEPEPVESPPPPPPPNGRQRRNDLIGLFSKEKSPK